MIIKNFFLNKKIGIFCIKKINVVSQKSNTLTVLYLTKALFKIKSRINKY